MQRHASTACRASTCPRLFYKSEIEAAGRCLAACVHGYVLQMQNKSMHCTQSRTDVMQVSTPKATFGQHRVTPVSPVTLPRNSIVCPITFVHRGGAPRAKVK